MKFAFVLVLCCSTHALKYLKTPQTPHAGLKTDESEAEAEYQMDSATAEQMMTSLTQQAFDEAIVESGLDFSKLSAFGQYSYRFPKSMVDHILKMRNTTQRKHKYNFVGRVRSGTPQEQRARAWAINFAKANFTENDIFVVTGVNGDWQPIGSFDKTKELGARNTHEKIKLGAKKQMDVTYWDMLVSSQYTLCPGGDDAFSHRAYEAALAGSIPLIKSVQADFSPYGSKSYQNLGKVFKLFKYQMKDAPHEYDQSIADHNLDVVIKYMTFIEGDNVPPN